MGFFLGDIAFMLELFGFVFGLVLLHYAKKDGGLIQASAVIMIAGSVLLALCTSMGTYKVCTHYKMECFKEMKEAARPRE
jgi:hypothetical protein